jgi:SAM-dependent methyltransferase
VNREPDLEITRTPERLKFHYDVERQLALKLKQASKEQRRVLYTAVYDELYRRVEDHPRNFQRSATENRAREVQRKVAYLRPMLRADATFLELGPGDCAVTHAMCPFVGQAIAVDVANEAARPQQRLPNFKLVISDGSSIPMEDGSVDLVFSDQLMEHLHPEDAADQLGEVARVLKGGGKYFCITPSRITGPHDITRYFDAPEPQGLHLKEYTYAELNRLFGDAGFSRRYGLIGAGQWLLPVPVGILTAIEQLYGKVPQRIRKKLRRSLLVRRVTNVLLGVRLVGVK